MTDTFANEAPGLSSPASEHYTITPDSLSDVTPMPRAIKVITGGTLSIMDKNGTVQDYTVTDGEVFSFRPKRVMDDTTAVVMGWR